MKRTALVVEDSEPCLQICRIILGHAGFEVCCSRSVPEALYALQKSTPDVLVCDLLLGTIGNGYDVIVALRGIEAKTFAVAVTASIGSDIEGHARRLGFDAFLRKPYAPSRLVELVL